MRRQKLNHTVFPIPVEALHLKVTFEESYVVLCASMKPELQCFCLEHEWRVKVEGPSGVLQEWGWRAKAVEEGYRGLSIKYIPPLKGKYKVAAELVTHSLRAETDFKWGNLNVAILIYSESGVTRTLVSKLASELEASGLKVDIFEVNLKRKYRRPLHLNPRLVLDTFRGSADAEIPKEFDPCSYSALIFACPIWIGRPAAPMASVLRSFSGKCPGKPVACITTSLSKANYSTKLAALAKAAGFKVVFHANAPRGVLSRKPEDIVKTLLQT